MWPGFDGKEYTRDEWLAHVATKVIFPDAKKIVLHATGNPDLKTWMSYPEDKRIVNLQAMYSGPGYNWLHGPHAFCSPTHIIGFSDLSMRGTHCSCENGDSLGIEQAGYYNPGHDAYDTGNGAAVRDNAVFCMAVLFRRMGFKVPVIIPHSSCQHDAHFQCPGEFVSIPDVTARVAAVMAQLAKPLVAGGVTLEPATLGSNITISDKPGPTPAFAPAAKPADVNADSDDGADDDDSDDE